LFLSPISENAGHVPAFFRAKIQEMLVQ